MRYPTAAAPEQADGSPVLFRFSYRDMPCRVVAGEAAVTLHAHMGIMPFTGDGPALRSRMLAVLGRARHRPGYGVLLAPDHGVGLTVTLASGLERGPHAAMWIALAAYGILTAAFARALPGGFSRWKQASASAATAALMVMGGFAGMELYPAGGIPACGVSLGLAGWALLALSPSMHVAIGN